MTSSMQKFSQCFRIPYNVSRVIRWFKGRTTFDIRKINPHFSWQARFHDRIIRNEKELQQKNLYIEQNPAQRESDILFREFLQR